MKTVAIRLLVLALIPAFSYCQEGSRPARPEVLLLAHGGRLLQWNEEVRHVADQVDLTIPTEIAFGMATHMDRFQTKRMNFGCGT